MPSKIASDLVLDVRRSLSDVTKRATSVRANASYFPINVSLRGTHFRFVPAQHLSEVYRTV